MYLSCLSAVATQTLKIVSQPVLISSEATVEIWSLYSEAESQFLQHMHLRIGTNAFCGESKAFRCKLGAVGLIFYSASFSAPAEHL